MALRMRLYDRHGRGRERALTLQFIDAGRSGHRDLDGDRLLIRFTHPADIRGTSFLVWEHPGREDERFLFLPALGRVRRIAGAERQESFVGSDFTYEDIGGRELADYTYRLLDEQATWSDPAGSPHQAYRLESIARDRNAPYGRVVSTILKDLFVVVRAEIFNRRGELAKRFDARQLEQTGGVWDPRELVMVNEREKTRTELVVEAVEYNVGLSPEVFSRRELERLAR